MIWVVTSNMWEVCTTSNSAQKEALTVNKIWKKSSFAVKLQIFINLFFQEKYKSKKKINKKLSSSVINSKETIVAGDEWTASLNVKGAVVN